VIRLLLKSELISLTKAGPKATFFNFSDITEDLTKINFDRQVEDAVLLNDYRLATRWLYLKTLFILDQNKHISFTPFKTTFDYRFELKGKVFESDFVNLSSTYEYVWYGQFLITENSFRHNAESFRQFETIIHV
jgi:hypothetical protein